MFLIRGALNVAVTNVARNFHGMAIPALPARHAIQKTSDQRKFFSFFMQVMYQWFFMQNNYGNLMIPVTKNAYRLFGPTIFPVLFP